MERKSDFQELDSNEAGFSGSEDFTSRSIGLPSKEEESKRRAWNGLMVSWVMAGFTFLIGAVSLLIALQSPSWQQFMATGATICLFVAAVVGAWLCHRRRPTLGIGILLGVFWVALVVISNMVEGFGLLLAIGGLLTTLTVAGMTLPPSAINWAIIGSLGTAGLIVLLEMLPRSWVIETSSTMEGPFGWVQGMISPLIVVALVVLVALVIYQFRRYSLRVKLLMVFVVLSLIAVGAEGAFYDRFLRNVLTQKAEEGLHNAAVQTAGTVDVFLQHNLDMLSAEAQLPVFATYLTRLEASAEGEDTEARESVRARADVVAALNALRAKDPVFITSYALLDRHGVDVADTYMPDVGSEKSARAYFQTALETGAPYVSGVRFYTKAEEGSAAGQTGGLYISAPIMTAGGDVLGVLRVRYAALILQQMLMDDAELGGTASFPLLVERDHALILAQGNQTTWFYRTVAPLNPSTFYTLQEARALPPGDLEDIVVPLDVFYKGLQSSAETFVAEIALLDEGQDERAGSHYIVVAPLTVQNDWVLAFAQPQEAFLGQVEAQSKRAVGFALLIGTIAVVASIVVARFLADPVVRLTDVAREVAGGNFDVQAPVETEDEIGLLARTFNTMTRRLRRILAQLEDRVINRTQALEQRSRYLEASAEVGRVVTSILQPEQLIAEVVDLIRERFGLYYVGLFLLDTQREWAELRAGTGEAGRAMLARGHRLPVDEDASMIGWCVIHGEARVAQDVELDAVRRATSELPETRAELALPLRARGQVLGALTVQSQEYGIFDQDAIRVLQVMADQVAAALDTAQLYSQSQTALETASRVYGELNRQAWAELLRADAGMTVRSTRYGVTVGEEEQSSSDLISSERSDSVSPTEIQGEGERAASLASPSVSPLSVPIRGRGGVIGVLETYKTGTGVEWSPDEVQVLKEITDRIGEALDGARLYRDTQRSAIREQQTSEITARIREEVDVEAILEKAVEELGRALEAQRAAVFLEVGDE